jgi:hypothetical protein
VPVIPTVPGSFAWFVPQPAGATPAIPPVPATAAKALVQAIPTGRTAPAATPPGAEDSRSSDLQRRVPGAQLPVAALRSPEPTSTDSPVHDASAARTAMDAFQSAVTRAGNTTQSAPPVNPTGPGSLSRRTPGASLAPSLREGQSAGGLRRVPTVSSRDPESARAAFDAYAAGLAEAARQAERAASHDDLTSHRTKEGT